MEFPLYRKYTNNKSFFKVTTHDSFEEVKFTGRRAEMFYVKATIHPDRMFIADMIALADGHWVESDNAEYEGALREVDLDL